MTDLLHILPNFPTTGYTHLIPSLEKHLITCTDLLTLDAVEVAKRAQLPVLDLRRLANEILAQLQGQLGLGIPNQQNVDPKRAEGETVPDGAALRRLGTDIVSRWSTISTLDDDLDAALGGGIPTSYITELTGESGTGKTQLLLSLLLSAQLPQPYGLSRPSLYISTEHALPTTRLSQLLTTNPTLTSAFPAPSLSRILTLQTPDLESQDHILTYQLPVILARHKPALVVIDSIAANYRAETSSRTTTPGTGPAALAQRSADLLRLGSLLRSLAREFDCAVVVANQVGDRFPSAFPPTQAASQRERLSRGDGVSSSPVPNILSPGRGPSPGPRSSPSLPLPPTSHPPDAPPPLHGAILTATPLSTLLTLDHQQRFFTGWGDAPASLHDPSPNLKTPSLGLVWSNQIACRIALTKSASYRHHLAHTPVHATARGGELGGSAAESGAGADWAPRGWRRSMRVVFAPWVAGGVAGEEVGFEIWGGGVRAVGKGA